MSNPLGKHVTIDINNPEALGICDKTGFVFNRKDLVKQMAWQGNALVWTGAYVGKPYLDKPSEQGRSPSLPPDPIPVVQPRPDANGQNAPSNDQTIAYLSRINFQN